MSEHPVSPPVAESDLEKTRRYLPWVVAVALFMQQLDGTIVNTAVPTMAESLGVASLALKSVLTSYTIAIAVLIPLSGWLADKFGTKRVFAFAVAVFTLGSLACGLSVNLPMLVASRVLQGIGAAFMMPVGRIALLKTFPKSGILRAMNFVIIPALLGPLLGPLTGGLIVHWLPWRVIFLINIPIGLLGLWLVKKHMPDHRGAVADPLDARGFILFGAGIALLSWVLEIFGEHRMETGWVAGLAAISLGLIGAYFVHARKSANPLLPVDLFRVRTFRVSVVGGFLTRLGISGMPFLLPLLYQLGMGFSPWQAGLLVMPQALAAIGMKLAVQRIMGHFGHKRVLLCNTVLIGLMIAAFSQVGPGTPVWVILIFSILQGSVSALQFTAMNSLAYADTTDEQASDASTVASTGQQLAISFGIAFASLVTAWFLGGIDRTNPAQLVPALHKAYLLLGGVTVASSAMFLTLRRADGDNVSGHGQIKEVVEA
ncbi:DHA2 family efflux MFS transporter permease subunit [Luteolibacter sp. GHJ8]|uniref:DHA2 family efflux MFS transporter permease subunit n=1 Tax=Luteolibacter rhizosphaerae TaxID=2989719 RepID=A0ABT3G5K1_9BACT|nr:DHA2 family efflux MFS transporter permease subunit [Luteolibacter rhizosphaerae]MCW1915093.1 DHA2 family efflux MFS transporter permease subunit [Luteolibacter rhizosphaerae]